MRIGLIGIHRSPDLCLVKREIEDRGHRAIFVNLRDFPQYTLGSVTPASIRFDHLDLLALDCFYLDELELRDRFFRGSFGKATWVSLRERYLEFAAAEYENLGFQLGLLLRLGALKPCMNPPAVFLKTRLRPATLLRLHRNGLPAAPVDLESAKTKGVAVGQGKEQALRIRVEEDRYLDVPCFPRSCETCLGIRRIEEDVKWRLIAVREGGHAHMIVVEKGRRRPASLPVEAGRLARKVLTLLGLELAEIHMVPAREGPMILDVLPSPMISEFEAVTGEPVAGMIADRLLKLGGTN